MKITLCNQKGGAGKTTLTMLLAMALANAGKRVGIIDLDKQETATKWTNSLDVENIEIVRSGESYDVIFYDTPPNLSETLKNALGDSEIAIVISSPSPADLWSTKETTDFITQSSVNVKVALLFNKVEKNRKLSEDLERVAEMVGIKSLKNNVPYYSAYQHAVLMGWKALQTKDKEAVLNVALEILTL